MFNDKQSRPNEFKPDKNKNRQHLQPFNKKLVLHGVLWFALVSIGSVAAVFFYAYTGDTLKALAGIKQEYTFICFGMVFIDLMLGSLRNHIYLRKLKFDISQWVSFKANVANMFMGAVTPFHSGAGPAQLYVYNRHGLPVLDGFVVSLINMGATLLFMPLAGLFAIWAMKGQLDSGLIPALLRYGFSVFFIFGAGFVLAFWKPLWIGAALRWLITGFDKFGPARKDTLNTWAEKSYNNILKYQRICRKLLGEHPSLFPLSLLITALLYLNKYCMQYVILLGLGIHANLTAVIGIQVLIQFMIYFAPSPGGSGFAEASIAALFAKLVPSGILPIFTLLQRSFLLFIPALIGSFVFVKLLKAHAGTT